MLRISSRLSKLLSLSILSKNASKQRSFLTSCSLNTITHYPRPQDPAIPADFLKWRALGSVRTSKFASGFTPLQPKPLDSIMDIERAKNKSPEDLASIWDDMPHIIFTGLEDYKARGTQASPYFTVSFYTEFADTKDLVLIRGDIVFTSKLTDEEAKCLLEVTQSFYLNDAKYKLVERFNKETRDFEFKDVLRALDMPIL